MIKKAILCGAVVLMMSNASIANADTALVAEPGLHLKHGAVAESITWTIKVSTAVKDGRLASGDQFAAELHIPDGECRSVDLMNRMGQPDSAASAKVCVGGLGAGESSIVGWIFPGALQKSVNVAPQSDPSTSALINIQFEGARVTVDNQVYVLSARKVKKA